MNGNNQIPSSNNPMTTKQWIFTNLLLAIPIANIVLLFIWAFSKNTNINKKNYAKSCLILIPIRFFIGLFIIFVIVVLLYSVPDSPYYTI